MMTTFTKKEAQALETRILTAEGYRRIHGRGIKTKPEADTIRIQPKTKTKALVKKQK